MADDSGESESPDNRLRDRVDESRLKLWLILEADRRLVVAGLVAVVALSLLATGLALPAVTETLRQSDSVDTLFQGLLTATITGVTLVLTLNQLVLSQELGAVGDQRERMDGAMEFRTDAADVIHAPVSPARPSQFLRALVEVAGQQATQLYDAVDETDTAHDEVSDLCESLTQNADRVSTDLDGAQFGEFDVVSAALNFNYSWKIFAARRIGERYDLPPVAAEALDDLVETLELFGPAREHFKTLYFQWELIDLSRAILTTALPALLVSIGMIAFFDAGQYAAVVPIVVIAATISLLPFLVLLAYILRIATVTKHTLSIGPFILRETDQVAEVSWQDDESR